MKTLRYKAWFVCFFFVTFFGLLQLPVPAYADSANIDRIAGTDRYQTAAAISRKGWVSSDYAVLARGDDFADALCAGPLAAKYGAPILMTTPDQLNAAALTEMKRLGVKHLFITGGTGAISAKVETALRAAGITDIRRFAGNDRYETSALIAQELTSQTAMLATGENFPDALSASVPATHSGQPILLTRRNVLPDPVKAYLQQAGITQTYLIGGNEVVSDGVASLLPNPYRLYGSDRYQTNIAVIQKFESDLNFGQIYVAEGGGPRGNEFADALAGAVLAAKSGSPLILAGNDLSPAAKSYLLPKVTTDTRITGLGGEDAVTGQALQSIPALLVTAAGRLDITPDRFNPGDFGTIDLTYTLGEAFTNGTADFIFPDKLTPVDGQYLVTPLTTTLTYTRFELTDSGRKVSVSGITGKAGDQIKLSLIDKTLSQIGYYPLKVVADSDGGGSRRLPNTGTGNATKGLSVSTPQIGPLYVKLISYNRPHQALNPQGFVIHSTATPGKDAEFFYNYFNSRNRDASAHYVADWNEVIQLIPEQEVAWHAGPTANHRYLSVEMCEPDGNNPEQFQKVWDRTVALVADACVRYGWNVRDHVFSHYQMSMTYKETNHTDPIGFLGQYDRTWDQLIQAIEAKVNEIKSHQ
jgi:putative cell wall-binding protein